MALFLALLAVAAFAVAIWRLHVLSIVGGMPDTVSSGISAMFDQTLDDTAKEKAVQQAGLRLLGTGARLFAAFAIALIAAAVPIYLADFLGLAAAGSVFDLMLRLDFIVAVTVGATLIAWLFSRRKSVSQAPAKDPAYGAGDRMVHTLAFASPGMQRGMARLDDRLYSAALAQVSDRPPVFITSLARGGTTALLNAMHGLPQFATHQYRDMPFVTAPLLWSRLSGRRRDVEKRQRAHGDGMEIDLDSPEAFDEVFWLLFWPEHYAGKRIGIWSEREVDARARDFMQAQFRKIVLLRRPDVASRSVSYLSKNNANVARLRLLPKMFPESRTVIPLRGPAAHAASLYRQHMNFLDLHGHDAFGMKYMGDIGHFEFGNLHKPIDFPGFDPGSLTPRDPDYWLVYWLAAFRDVTANGDAAQIVTQDALRADPDRTMHALLERLDAPAEGSFATFFRRTPDPQPEDMFRADLLSEARQVYDELAARCVGAALARGR